MSRGARLLLACALVAQLAGCAARVHVHEYRAWVAVLKGVGGLGEIARAPIDRLYPFLTLRGCARFALRAASIAVNPCEVEQRVFEFVDVDARRRLVTYWELP